MDNNDQIEFPPPMGWRGSYNENFSPKEIDQHQNKIRNLSETGRKLWRELFLEVNSTDDLRRWEDRIPSFECNCKRFYTTWKNNNPPTIEGDSIAFQWKWKLKSAVNQKLGHADLSLEEAKSFWDSQTQ